MQLKFSISASCFNNTGSGEGNTTTANLKITIIDGFAGREGRRTIKRAIREAGEIVGDVLYPEIVFDVEPTYDEPDGEDENQSKPGQVISASHLDSGEDNL